jgi:phage shock protein C
MNPPFALDKGNSKLMGVCAGLARATGLDPLAVRLGTVLAAVVAGPVVIAAYALTAWLAASR